MFIDRLVSKDDNKNKSINPNILKLINTINSNDILMAIVRTDKNNHIEFLDQFVNRKVIDKQCIKYMMHIIFLQLVREDNGNDIN